MATEPEDAPAGDQPSRSKRELENGGEESAGNQVTESNGKMQVTEMKTPGETSSMPPRLTPFMRQREVMEKEKTGELKFEVITNDGRDETMIALIELKNIFAKQLPKMPKEYIVRLVFDRNHYSLVCISESQIVGGICYRPHFTQGFAEIAFCAVTAIRQVKGFGTRMMNQLKQSVKKDGIEYFLTYADNYAIGYFKKQGFTRQVTMKRERWVGFIKDYDGGTLMECPISEHVDYTDLPKMIDEQRSAILEKMQSMCDAHVVHPPITETHQFELNERGDMLGTSHITSAEQIPGLAGKGVRLPTYTYTFDGQPSTLETIMERAISALLSHPDSWPFLSPVNVSEAPDYYDIIKCPIDLAMIQRRAACGHYRTLRQFVGDIKRMVKNCRAYNGEGNIWSDCAASMEKALMTTMANARETPIRDSEDGMR